MLCINQKALKVDKRVQKDIDVVDLLLKETMNMNTINEAFKCGYLPLNFCICVRSIYSNQVLQQTINRFTHKHFFFMEDVPDLIHKGNDLIFYMNSLGLMNLVNYDVGFDELMMKYSMSQLIGIYNPSPSFFNPTVVSHIILHDEGFKKLTKYLKQGIRPVNIALNLRDKNNSILTGLYDTLIIVKGKENAKNDHH